MNCYCEVKEINLFQEYMMMDEDLICSFPPLINDTARIIILGTIPGVVSLEKDMYYANDNNHFWDFIYRILIPDLPFDCLIDERFTKESRYEFLKKHGIALWDIIKCCKRKGSNDSKIKDPTYNDLLSIISSNIKAIVCNGGEAFKFLKASGQLERIDIPVQVIGSTSTLNPKNTFRTLIEWDRVLSGYLTD